MAYDETTLINEIQNAADGDIIEITADIHLFAAITITKNIIVQSLSGNNFKIFQENPVRHFNCLSAVSALTLKNITLDGGGTGGGINVNTGGRLSMGGGSIIQNCFSYIGGGIALGSGASTSVIMQSGSIIQNCAGDKHGGGVYIGPSCTFTMENGSVISGCSTKEYGGGIYIVEGIFIMNGGEISDCRSAGGGGVFLYYPEGSPLISGVSINGGTITGCLAPFGGGILFLNTVRVSAMNAVVTGNYSTSYGGGIGILSGSLININTSLVKGNFAQLSEGSDAQIYIYSEQLPFGGTTYTLVGSKSSAISVALLNGNEYNLVFFKVKDDISGEYYASFCAEPETEVVISDFFTIYYLHNMQLKREITDKIAITIKTALGGVRSYDAVESNPGLCIRAYVAQYLIWNIVTGYHISEELITTIDRIRAAFGEAAADCLNEIVAAIRYYENPVLPSFAGGSPDGALSYYLKFDSSDGKWKITLTDTNGVLNRFTVEESSLPQGLNVILDYGNNTMTVVCDNKSVLKDRNIIIKLVSLIEDGDASVYFHPLYQDLIIPDNKYAITINAYIKPLIYVTVTNKSCPCYNTKCRTAVNGKKIWKDNGSHGDTRPEKIEILLLRDGEIYQNLFLETKNSESFAFCCLPVWNKSGDKYVYQIDEVVPDGYTKTIEGNNIINTLDQ